MGNFLFMRWLDMCVSALIFALSSQAIIMAEILRSLGPACLGTRVDKIAVQFSSHFALGPVW
jgi:hypothetical protein